MTPDEINRAIAEHLGWTQVRVIPPHPRRKSEGSTIAGNPPATSKDRSILVPSYAEDLNAMHEAELKMGCQHALAYPSVLISVVRLPMGDDTRRAISATATQRAEAFLRTIGKWRGA